MTTYIDKILNELSYRVSNGTPNFTNEQHLIKLFDVLKELDWSIEGRVELLKNLQELQKYKNNAYNRKMGRVGQHWGTKGTAPKKEPEKEKPEKKEREQKIKKTKKQIKVAEDLKEDLDFILENKDAVRLKSGGGSNSPSVQDVKDLQIFTQKRMEQDKRRLEAEEKGEEFNEEPYVHPSIVQREVDDATLDRAIDYLEESLEPEEFEALMKRFAKGGAVPRHLTKLTKLKKGQPGYPGLDKNSPGYKRAREIIRLYLKLMMLLSILFVYLFLESCER